MKLADHFRRYLELVSRVDSLFEDVMKNHSELMACKPGCDDCCNVYFELSLIEAFYVSGMFREGVLPAKRAQVLTVAEHVEPEFEKCRAMFRDLAETRSASARQLEDAASRLNMPCPLNEGGMCLLYDHRPITCRLYGTPQKIGDRVVSCPLCGYQQGESYLTVDVNEIQQTLYEYSRDFLLDMIDVKLSGPPGPLFPMPTALRTVFDKDFFLALRKQLT